MEAFTHLSVLLSIILGLGMAELLGGFTRLIEHRSTARLFAPAICWALLLLIVHVQTWWTLFGLRGQRDWTFLSFCVVLLQPIALYLLASLVFPRGEHPDLRSSYFANRRWFFAFLIFLLLASLAKDLVLSGSLPSTPNLAFHVVLLVTSAVAIYTPNERFHRQLAFSSLAMILLYIGLLFSRLT